MIKRCNKKGSHVAVVISFIIFVTFMVFLFTMAKGSFQTEKNKDSLIEYLKTKLIEETSSQLNTVTVNLSKTSSQACVELNGIVPDFGITSKVIVKNQNQITTPSSVNGDNLRIIRINNNDQFFKIYTSNEFPLTGTGSWTCDQFNEGTDYNLGIAKTEKYVFEDKVFDLITRYSDYKNLKEYLKIPEGTDFGIGFVYENGTSINVGIKDVTTDVYIKETPVQYVSRGGDIKSGFLRIIVW
jgi:hypothetical protein